jgi:hypothetical protein
MNTNKILTIGDIHGRSSWKEIIFGGETEFFFWKQAVTEGYLEHEGVYKFQADWDKIIFVGDYADSYDIKGEDIVSNLEEIVLFAKTYPDLVVLLLGNHDVHYIVSNECCSGYRGELRPELNRIYTENDDLFKAAYLDVYEEGDLVKKTLWTHAGVTEKWYREALKDVNSPRFRLTDFFIGSENWEKDKFINQLWKLRVSNFFNVDYGSGGTDLWAGPIWVRPGILNEYPLEGYHQVVGHTPQKSIVEYYPFEGVELNPNKLIGITYVDVLANIKSGHIINRTKK